MRLPGLLTGLLACGALAAGAVAEQRVVDVREGTNLSLALSPDGDSLVVDLLGRLWRLPAAGGGAVPLTPGDAQVRNPRFGPRGQRVVYQGLDGGQWDLWLLDLADGRPRRLTQTPFDERQPEFSPDGRRVIFASNRGGTYDVWSLEIADGTLAQLTFEPGDALYPASSAFGQLVYVARDGERWSLKLLPESGPATALLSSSDALRAPSWRPTGGVIVFHEQQPSGASALKMLILSEEPVIKTLTFDEDVFAGRAAWRSPGEILYAADGRLWRRGLALTTRYPIELFAAVTVTTAAPPPGQSTPIDARGELPVLGVTDRALAPGGARSAFVALGDLWLSDEDEDAPRRLTDDAYVEADPVFTPDGEALIIASDRGGSMSLWQIELDSGQAEQLSFGPGKAYRPAIAPDSIRVAFLATDGLGPWSRSSLQLLHRGQPIPLETLAEDFVPAGRPQWRDGGDTLAVPVHGQGADRTRRVLEIDMRSGERRFREQTATGGVPEEAEAPLQREPALTWSHPAAAQRYVVQAGRLFDGIRSEYLRDVDIHVDGSRITAVVERGLRALPDTVIDARAQTVIPGLIDLHAHQSALAGERLGRAWLAYGVTTVREVGDDRPAALERSESWASGRRLGPRLIVAEAPPLEPDEAPPAIGQAIAHAMPQLEPPLGAELDSSLPAGLLGNRAARPQLHPLEVSPYRRAYQDQIGTIVAAGIVVLPTLAALNAGRLSPATGSYARVRPYLTLFTSAERDRWDRGDASMPQPALATALLSVLREGGRVGVASDAPATPYGLGLHAELRLLSAAGIPNDRVLRLATAEGALALGLETDLGIVEAGKLADFVVLDGDPLVRIDETEAIVAVVKGGLWLDRERLLADPPASTSARPRPADSADIVSIAAQPY